MKRTLLFVFALLAALSWSGAAVAQSSVFVCIGPPGIGACTPVSATNPFPVSGTFTPSTTSANFTPVAPATATATKGTLLGLQYDSTQKTLTDGQQAAASGSARGALFVAVGADGFAVTNAGTFATQSAITAASGAISSGAVASGAFASGAIGSGAIASGAVASGAFASGAFASGSFASGSQSVGITPTNRTVTSATGSSQTVMSASATRKQLTILNTGNANCGINPTGGTAVIGGDGTMTLAPLGAYTPRVPTLSAVTAICTAGQPLYADES